jgi:hypothetical protein
MREDVRKLTRMAGWQEGSYVEVAAAQVAAEALRAWPLLVSVNSRLLAAAASASVVAAEKGGR